MADGYARVSGRTAAVLVTTGPGVLNTLTPLAESYADSQPALEVATVGEPQLRDPTVVDRAAELLLAAARPVLFAGGGLIATDGSEALRAVAEALNAPVLTSASGKGAIDELHPLAMGCTWGLSSMPRSGGM